MGGLCPLVALVTPERNDIVVLHALDKNAKAAIVVIEEGHRFLDRQRSMSVVQPSMGSCGHPPDVRSYRLVQDE